MQGRSIRRMASRVASRAAAPLVVCLLAASAFADRLYAVSGSGTVSSTLYELDPTDGSLISTIGSTGLSHMTGIAFHPTTGVLYAVENNTGTLLTMNPATAATTTIGSTSAQIPDIAFSPSGVLYGWFEPGIDDLITIDLTTGAVTIVGDSSLGTANVGIAVSAGGTIYMHSVGTLYTIDGTTGAVVSSITLDRGLSNVLAFDSAGVLYGGLRNGSNFELYTVDFTTGTTTLVGSVGLSNISAIAFQAAVVPEPGTMALFGIGGLGLAITVVRRRRARSAAAGAAADPIA